MKNKLVKFILLLILAILICIPTMVKATGEITSSVTLSNGQTMKVTYTVNASNQIENLKCTNPIEISGNLEIPSTIDGKIVIQLENEAFLGGKNITKVTIPSSVKTIEYKAFANCASLSSVDLGSVESLSFDIFEGCTSLKSITIPKSLKNGSVSPVFTNCTNLTKITFEEGLTVIPRYLCATTGITEVTIPSSVKTIEYDAFTNCASLKKITILDNVEYISFDVFKNHNKDLTIYCYKGSVAAKYAIDNNIKYVYLEKEEPTEKPTNNTVSNNTISENKNTIKNNIVNNVVSNKTKDNTVNNVVSNKTKDNTIAKGNLPKTGLQTGIIALIVVAIAGTYGYIKYRNLRDVK